MKIIDFAPWQVMGSLPWQADFSKHIQEGVQLPGLTPWIPASVPGCVYQDLWKAGLIEDPYYRENSLHCEWVANRWWAYRTEFSLRADELNAPLRLCFHGIDYSAQIYLNGIRLGRHEGMYLPFTAIVNDAVREGKNTLVCVLEHAPFADPQPGYTSKTRYLKARFNYKWDFATRLVSLGLYDHVTLTSCGSATIVHSLARPVKTDGGWKVEVELELDVYRNSNAEISFRLNAPHGKEGGTVVSGTEALQMEEGMQKWRTSFPVENPFLWWPNGYGEQNLYPLTIGLSENGSITAKVDLSVGFRTLAYQCADGREDALPYLTVINGKRIYLKGTNLVPLDCMTGSVSPETVRERLQAARDANLNYLRIWGGGHLESEEFYRACDEYGLMVLQEFPMSSSGCDDVPSRNPEFLDLLQKAAIHTLKRLRNHVSLTFLDGGNELTDARYLGRTDHEGHPATFEDPTLAMLKGLAETLCPGIQMLPSSASGPNALLNPDTPGKNHDVHGPWGYSGVEAHYTLYNRSDSIVHGEFGCGGMSNYDSICRFTAPEDRQLYTSLENRIWAHHSGGWDAYAMRERMMFGDLKGLPFPDYIKVSQYVQAEALRYALEANRRRQWKNVGEMTWQFNEPWPNMQCSNVLDYYGGKKLAYYAMKEAYTPVLASLRYERLFYRTGEEFRAELHLLSDLPDSSFEVTFEIRCGEELLATGTKAGTIQEDTSFMLCTISQPIPEGTESLSVRLRTSCGGFTGDKEYLFLIANRQEDIILTEEEQQRLLHFKNKGFTNPPDAPKANVQPVIDYVDRWLSRTAVK